MPVGSAAAFPGDMSHAVVPGDPALLTLCGQDYSRWSVIDYTDAFPGTSTGLVCGACTRTVPLPRRTRA